MELKDKIQTEKLHYIDALRGFAILGVIAVHISQTQKLNLSDDLLNFFSQGFRGVQLFFMVSAFTLFTSFNKRIKFETGVYKNFYIRRFFRIAPMYYLAILFYTLYNNSSNVEIGVLLNLLLVHGLSIEWINNIVPGGWSVGIEFLFYAMLPILYLIIKTSKGALYFYIFSLIVKGISMLLLANIIIGFPKESLDYFIYFSLPNQLSVFALGIILFFIIKEDNWSLKQFNNKSLLILFGILMYSLIYRNNIFFEKNDFYNILFFIFFLVMSRTKSKILINKLICYIGKISFSLYLVHFSVISMISKLFYIFYSGIGIIDYSFRYILVCIISIIISSITYYAIELYFQKIANKLIIKIAKKTNI